MFPVVALCSAFVVGGFTQAAQSQPNDHIAIELSADGSLSVIAEWAPIAGSTYRIHEKPESARHFDLKPAAPTKNYAAADFKALLPAERVAVGDVWKINDTAVLDILRQFHPSPTTELHHGTGAGGGFACLRAVSPTYAEIVLRLHAEFVLDPGKVYYTPAQFAGRVVIDREERRVVEFVLDLPDRNSNVDINVLPYADIVYVPRMRLSGGAAPDGINWTAAIEPAAARARLAAKFYKFAAIRWTPLPEALDRARAEKKLLHIVVLFGTLDDESC